MKFLFRAPLLDVDPRDEKEILENWERILKIISVSSTSLFEEISQKPYSSLPPKVKLKIYKYILRGRYRSTPFGLLAAVGLGEFNDKQNYTLDLLNASPIPPSQGISKSVTADTGGFYLAEGGYEKIGNIHFLSYQLQNERWGLTSIPNNKSLNFIINQLKCTKTIDFEQFKELFEDPTGIPAKEIWNMMLELGIFNSVEFVASSKPYMKPKTDMVFKDEISLPPYMLTDLREFYNQAGSLFCKAENHFLKSFKGWFTDKFDDRFIPLTLLIQYADFVSKVFLKRRDQPSESSVSPEFNVELSSLKSLDLKPLFPKKPLDPEIFDLQLAFKTGEDLTSIILENAVCNRPFVYYGRFNRDNKLYWQQEKTKCTIYQSEEVLYAELKLIESGNVESICDTKQVFDHYITAIYESNSRAINFDEVEIGLKGNEFQLIHRPSLRKIVPVIVHPLNGEEISHPIMRLLWEIAHHTPYAFFPYTLRKNKAIDYIPQLNWGGLVLQSRRWTIQFSSFSTIEEVGKWMKNNNLPDPLVMGYLDRELVLHWGDNKDLEILWAELSKWKRLILSDPIWLKGSLFSSYNNRSVFPQFIVQQSNAKHESPVPLFVNSIESVATDCLYILFRIQEEECEDFLYYIFDEKLLNFLNQQEIIWYFIVYPSEGHLQVRIRFLRLKITQKNLLNAKLSEIAVNSLLSYEFRTYYPEQKKYGMRDYTKSEQLFHLESCLVMEANWGIEGERIINNTPIKLGLIVELWTGVITDIQAEEHYFTFLKARVKSIPNKEMIEFRNYFKEFTREAKNLTEFPDWLESYRDILFSHSMFLAGNEVGMGLVQNHIHMQVNRFFPTERRKMESLIYFLLYRKLGQQLYRKPQLVTEGIG